MFMIDLGIIMHVIMIKGKVRIVLVLLVIGTREELVFSTIPMIVNVVKYESKLCENVQKPP